MGKINILTKDIYNRIAAGEVVDRPYSALKELVENSLDAGATEISIYIEKGGRQLIKVCDNGSGIEADDMSSAFLPHATSKVSKVEDLDVIKTLGFRGEALASISSISRTEIISVTAGNPACRVVCEGGYTGKVEPAALDKGTEVAVHDLFYNTPVRAKFLKSDKAEEGDIQNFVSRFILGNPEVSFRYYSEGKLRLQSFGNGLDEAVTQVYGAKVIPQCFKINAEKNGIKIHGFIGNQNFFKPNKSYQSLFLNGRYIINNIISSAITNAYASYLMKRQYPFYVLFVDVPTDMVDVNVHPNKADVRFTDGRLIYSAVYSVISSILDGTARAADFVVDSTRIPEIKSSMPESEMSFEQYAAKGGMDFGGAPYSGGKQLTTDTVMSGTGSVSNGGAFSGKNNSLPCAGYRSSADGENGENNGDTLQNYQNRSLSSYGTSAESAETPGADGAAVKSGKEIKLPDFSNEKSASYSRSGEKAEQSPYEDYEAPKFEDRENTYPIYAYYGGQNEKHVLTVSSPPAGLFGDGAVENSASKPSDQQKLSCHTFTYKGNLFNTYLLYEIDDSVYLIDQHAAHERLIYDRLKEQMSDREVPRQGMLVPYVISLTPAENSFFEENLSVIRDMGFDIEPFGINAYRVCEVPADLKDMDLKGFFDEILGDIAGFKSIKMEGVLKDKLAMAACKHAVKGGMELTRQEADGLLEKMQGDMGLKCPHGRPVAVKLTKYQIEKMFKRIV